MVFNCITTCFKCRKPSPHTKIRRVGPSVFAAVRELLAETPNRQVFGVNGRIDATEIRCPAVSLDII